MIQINLIFDNKKNYINHSFLSNSSSDNSIYEDNGIKIQLSNEINHTNNIDKLKHIENKYQNVRSN